MNQPPLPPGVLTDPSRPLTFTFEGRTIPALEGQSIGAALYAAGVRIFSRSFKYHRPRGLFCVSGDCPNCLMQVDGRPNVRTCIEPARQGQVVKHQNAWPSLEFDVLRIFDKLDRFLPVGFYYKRFHKPRWLWPIFEHLVRHIAGIGRVDVHDVPQVAADVEHLHTEVCVVGGGPAGMAAAHAAAEAGAEVLLLERMPRLGGHLLYEGDRLAELEPLLSGVQGHARVRVECDTTAFGLYEGNVLGAFRGDCLLRIRAQQIIVCTGARQILDLFENNDLPGIFFGRAAQRLARLYGVRPGQRAVVYCYLDDGRPLAADLARMGVNIAAVVDPAPVSLRPGTEYRWPSWNDSRVVECHGDRHLQAVTVQQFVPRESGGMELRDERIDCDLLCIAGSLAPANELLRQGGLRFRSGRGGWRPVNETAGLLAAGGAVGTFDLPRQVLEGRLRGAEAAAAVGCSPVSVEDYRRQWAADAGAVGNTEDTDHRPTSSIDRLQTAGRKRFVCLCEDVTEKDVVQAIGEGFDQIETLKRYSTATMGPCQGKICGEKLSTVCAVTLGQSAETIGVTTSRPPVVPVELAVLAADRKHHPVRRTPLHHWHQAHGARWLDAGQWKRPESYGDPLAEVKAVRNGVGLIDVSTLGKIELIGPDAAELLERVYLNRWADLKEGRARYGAMCTEEGILFDDGVGARRASKGFYLTATTGNAEAVFQWLELWRTTWGLDVLVVNQTSAFAAMNLAGPKAREVLAPLTGIELSTPAFPYMAFREGEVAGVPCRLLRIGFVGELGYEIHCPSAQAWHLWESLVSAGEKFGLKPFGVEAQRILRLEKGHLIIGQDSDALSNPLEAGLEWLVRFDKPRFHGRETLVRLKEMGPRAGLVGFQFPHRLPPADSTWARGLEGCQVVEHGRPVGRVTSARWSPTLERYIGLAWVPDSKKAVGSRFHIRSHGNGLDAVVAPLPFYDPDGNRLKS